MAKPKPDLSDIFASTTQSQAQPEAKRKRNPDQYPVSIYLTVEEKAEIDAMAKAMGVPRHKVLQQAMRYFMAAWRAGKVKTSKRVVTDIDIDS